MTKIRTKTRSPAKRRSNETRANLDLVNPRVAILFEQAYRELRPRAPLPEFKIQFFPFTNLNNTIRLREGRILVRISDLLEGAPESVLHAILHILIAKLYRKEIHGMHAVRFRRFAGSKDIA